MTEALGSIETVGYVVAIAAADAAVKSANIRLLGAENARGGGLVTIKFVGDVGAVKAAVSAGIAAAEKIGKVASCSVIPRPATGVGERIRLVDLGVFKPKAKNTWAPTPEAPAAEPKAEPDPEPEPAAPAPVVEAIAPAPEPAPIPEPVPEVPAAVEEPAIEAAVEADPEPVVEAAPEEPVEEPAAESAEPVEEPADEVPPPPSGGEPPKPGAPAPHRGAPKRRGRR